MLNSIDGAYSKDEGREELVQFHKMTKPKRMNPKKLNESTGLDDLSFKDCQAILRDVCVASKTKHISQIMDKLEGYRLEARRAKVLATTVNNLVDALCSVAVSDPYDEEIILDGGRWFLEGDYAPDADALQRRLAPLCHAVTDLQQENEELRRRLRDLTM